MVSTAVLRWVGGDPEDVLADVASQLAWMHESGLVDVDCFWHR